MSDERHLLINLILYGLLPLWGIAGLCDWFCHRASKIEHTSGLKESLIHSAMGIQLGIPIVLCLVFRINVPIMLICLAIWVLHEIVAHWDVYYSAPLRTITIWEVHVHNYMATVPLYLIMLIVVLNWDVALQTATLQWDGSFELQPIARPHGSSGYLRGYLAFMAVLCVLPYAEENLRCLRAARARRRATA